VVEHVREAVAQELLDALLVLLVDAGLAFDVMYQQLGCVVQHGLVLVLAGGEVGAPGGVHQALLLLLVLLVV